MLLGPLSKPVTSSTEWSHVLPHNVLRMRRASRDRDHYGGLFLSGQKGWPFSLLPVQETLWSASARVGVASTRPWLSGFSQRPLLKGSEQGAGESSLRPRGSVHRLKIRATGQARPVPGKE